MKKMEALTFSTDIGGLWPDFEEVTKIYEQAGFGKVGLEVVWTRNINKKIQNVYTGNNRRSIIYGFHGQLGTESSYRDHSKGIFDWLLIHVADFIIRDQSSQNLLVKDMFAPLEILPPLLLADMTAVLTERGVYFNIHDDVAKNQYVAYRDGVLGLGDTEKSGLARARLVVENGPSSAGVENVAKLVERFRSDTGNNSTGGLFDVVHAIIGLSSGEIPDIEVCKKYWTPMLKLINKKIFTNFHFPIGEKKDDSLPILEMIGSEIGMLKDLSDVIDDMQITIENQHSLIFGATLSQNREISRLKRIRDAMEKVGMIN